MDLPAALAEGLIQACNTCRSSEHGYQVSVMRPGSSGWQVFFGPDLHETIQRAIDGGSQLPEDDWSHLV